MTCWDVSEHYDDPCRFRMYRLFTLAAACVAFSNGQCTEDVLAANYVALRLLNDAHALGDREINASLGMLLVEMPEILKSQSWLEEEFPFFHVAEMVWAQRRGDFSRSSDAAKKLLNGEQLVREHDEFCAEDARFLFGLTIYDQLNEEWLNTLSELTIPYQDEEFQLVVEALKTES